MLKPYTKSQENRIVRNIIQACTKDINKLNKYGYRWLHIMSGFIAHYNLHGFISHYGYSSALKSEILSLEKDQWCNYREGEQNYPYYKQKSEMYKRICDILRGKRRMPAESTCFKAPSLKKIIDDYKEKGYCSDNSIQTCIDKYMHIFECGTFYCGDYKNRAVDLAYITELFTCLEADAKVNDDNFYHKEFIFPSGNAGTFYELMRVYGDHLYETFAELTGQVEEVEV